MPSAQPDENEMVRLGAQHDVGLALELSTPPNQPINLIARGHLTNKIFTYLLAGIVVLGSIPWRSDRLLCTGQAAWLIDLDEPKKLLNLSMTGVESASPYRREALRHGARARHALIEIRKKRFIDGIAVSLRYQCEAPDIIQNQTHGSRSFGATPRSSRNSPSARTASRQ